MAGGGRGRGRKMVRNRHKKSVKKLEELTEEGALTSLLNQSARSIVLVSLPYLSLKIRVYDRTEP